MENGEGWGKGSCVLVCLGDVCVLGIIKQNNIFVRLTRLGREA